MDDDYDDYDEPPTTIPPVPATTSTSIIPPIPRTSNPITTPAPIPTTKRLILPTDPSGRSGRKRAVQPAVDSRLEGVDGVLRFSDILWPADVGRKRHQNIVPLPPMLTDGAVRKRPIVAKSAPGYLDEEKIFSGAAPAEKPLVPHRVPETEILPDIDEYDLYGDSEEDVEAIENTPDPIPILRPEARLQAEERASKIPRIVSTAEEPPGTLKWAGNGRMAATNPIDSSEELSCLELLPSSSPAAQTEYTEGTTRLESVSIQDWENRVMWDDAQNSHDLNPTDENELSDTEGETSANIPGSKLPTRNRAIESGAFVRDICWDEKGLDTLHHPLLFDMNDTSQLFQNLAIEADAITRDKWRDEQRLKRESEERMATVVRLRESKRPTAVKEAEFLEKEEELWRMSIDRHHNLDPWNLSGDHFYKKRVARVKQKLGKKQCVHSKPGVDLEMVQYYWSQSDLLKWHKLGVVLYGQAVYELKPTPLELRKQGIVHTDVAGTGDQVLQIAANDLTANHGHVVLWEYWEEHPSWINNGGMGTRVRNYYRKASVKERNAGMDLLISTLISTPIPSPHSTPLPHLISTAIPQFDDGNETIVLEPDDASPLLGDIAPGQSAQIIENNMFKALIFPHEPEDTDFLLVFTQKEENMTFFIRDMPSIYTIGPMQPEMLIPLPNVGTNFQIKRLNMLIMRKYQMSKDQCDDDEEAALRSSDIHDVFPVNENRVRKSLTDMGFDGTGTGIWTMHAEAKYRKKRKELLRVTPEEIVMHDSMLAGYERLCSEAITFYSSEDIRPCIKYLDGEDQLIAQYIDDKIMEAPWNHTDLFIKCRQAKPSWQLDLNGRGDGYCFIPTILKMGRDGEEQTISRKSKLAGTLGDLRKLSMKEAQDFLIGLGDDEREVRSLQRWRLIDRVRETANDMTRQGLEGVGHFTRHHKFSFRQHEIDFKRNADELIQRQIEDLSSSDKKIAEGFENADVPQDYDGEKAVRRRGIPDLIDTSSSRDAVFKHQEEKAELESFKQLVGATTTTAVLPPPSIPPPSNPPPSVVGPKAAPTAPSLPGTNEYKRKNKHDRDKELRAPRPGERKIIKTIYSSGRTETITNPHDVEGFLKSMHFKVRVKESSKSTIKPPQIKMKRSETAPPSSLPASLPPSLPPSHPPSFHPPSLPRQVSVLKISKAVLAKSDQAKRRARTAKIQERRGRDEDEEMMRGPSVFTSKRQMAAQKNDKLKQIYTRILEAVMHITEAKPFCEPVKTRIYTDYLSVIQPNKPMCFAAMFRTAQSKTHPYTSRAELLADFELLKENCIKYNTGRHPLLLQYVSVVEQRLLARIATEDPVLAQLEASEDGDIDPHVTFKVPEVQMSVAPPPVYESMPTVIPRLKINMREGSAIRLAAAAGPSQEQIKLNINKIIPIINDIWDMPDSEVFHFTVNTDIYFDYLDIVHRPICLEDIRRKAMDRRYKSIDAFVADMAQMMDNVKLYYENHDESLIVGVDLVQSAIKFHAFAYARAHQ